MFYEYKDFMPFQSMIIRRFGNIRRARGFYLYTDKKVRLLDMYLNGGRAILGHRPRAVITQYKKELDKGVCAVLPTKNVGELRAALKVLFPQYKAVFYSSPETALKSASRLMKDYVPGSKDLSGGTKVHQLGQPHTIYFDYVNVPVYRPFMNEDLGFAFLFFPYPSISTTILLTKKDNGIVPEYEEAILPAEQVAISAFVHLLIARQKQESNEVACHSMRIKKELAREVQAQKERKALLPLISTFFDMEGCYLYFKKDCGMSYRDFFVSAINEHILLSPWVDDPSIFPTLQHYGQLTKFLKKVSSQKQKCLEKKDRLEKIEE